MQVAANHMQAMESHMQVIASHWQDTLMYTFDLLAMLCIILPIIKRREYFLGFTTTYFVLGYLLSKIVKKTVHLLKVTRFKEDIYLFSSIS